MTHAHYLFGRRYLLGAAVTFLVVIISINSVVILILWNHFFWNIMSSILEAFFLHIILPFVIPIVIFHVTRFLLVMLLGKYMFSVPEGDDIRYPYAWSFFELFSMLSALFLSVTGLFVIYDVIPLIASQCINYLRVDKQLFKSDHGKMQCTRIFRSTISLDS